MILAKEMIQSKRAVTKLYASKAHMNSVLLSMKNQLGELGRTSTGALDRTTYIIHVSNDILSSVEPVCSFIIQHNVLLCILSKGIVFCVFIALLRVAGALQKSTEVMKAMQNLVKIPEIQGAMRELSKEMMKVSTSAQHK